MIALSPRPAIADSQPPAFDGPIVSRGYVVPAGYALTACTVTP